MSQVRSWRKVRTKARRKALTSHSLRPPFKSSARSPKATVFWK